MKINLKEIKQKKSTEELLEFSIINIDKSSGPTSFNVSNFVKRSLNLRKTSHFGTLDPKVTGVLPVALNRACKLSGFFLGEDKTYVGIARFHEKVELEKVEKTITEKFLGKIKQTPPLKSRVKRQEREREIYYFKIIEQEENDFLFETKVQGGTYIRKLIDDLGRDLGTSAHMLELRREQAGIFSENNKIYPSVTLYEFEKAVEEYKQGNDTPLRKILIPAEIVAEVCPEVQVSSKNLKIIYSGKPIRNSEVVNFEKLKLEKGKLISIFNKDKFIGVYKVTLEPEIFARPEFVMQPVKQ